VFKRSPPNSKELAESKNPAGLKSLERGKENRSQETRVSIGQGRTNALNNRETGREEEPHVPKLKNRPRLIPSLGWGGQSAG